MNSPPGKVRMGPAEGMLFFSFSSESCRCVALGLRSRMSVSKSIFFPQYLEQTFVDRVSVQKGEIWWPAILNRAEKAVILVVVFTLTYFESKYALQEFLSRLSKEGSHRPILVLMPCKICENQFKEVFEEAMDKIRARWKWEELNIQFICLKCSWDSLLQDEPEMNRVVEELSLRRDIALRNYFADKKKRKEEIVTVPTYFAQQRQEKTCAVVLGRDESAVEFAKNLSLPINLRPKGNEAINTIFLFAWDFDTILWDEWKDQIVRYNEQRDNLEKEYVAHYAKCMHNALADEDVEDPRGSVPTMEAYYQIPSVSVLWYSRFRVIPLFKTRAIYDEDAEPYLIFPGLYQGEEYFQEKWSKNRDALCLQIKHEWFY